MPRPGHEPGPPSSAGVFAEDTALLSSTDGILDPFVSDGDFGAARSPAQNEAAEIGPGASSSSNDPETKWMAPSALMNLPLPWKGAARQPSEDHGGGAMNLDGSAELDRQPFEKWLPSPVRSQVTHAPFRDEYGEQDDVHQSLLPDDQGDEERGRTQEMPISPRALWGRIPISLPPRDAAWVVIYAICFASMIFLWLALLVTSVPRANMPNPGMLLAIYDSLPVLISVFCVSCLLGSLWVLLMGAFVKFVLWATVIFIPAASAIVTSWALYLLFTPATVAQSAFLILLTVTTVITGVVFTVLIYLHKDKIDMTISIVQLATHILRCNPSLFLMSLALLGAHLVFVVIWIAMTARFVTLASWASSVLSGAGDMAWIAGVRWTPTLLFFTGMLVWTSCIINNIHRMSVACVVHHWYFSRHISRLSGKERVKRALHRSVTVSIGTCCCGALLEAVVLVARVLVQVHRRLRDHLPKIPDIVSRCLTPLVSFILRLAEITNRYTLAYSSITSHDYMTSARNSTQLVARSLSTMFLREVFTRATLLLGTAILSAVVGLGVVTSLRSDRSVDNVSASSIAGVVAVCMWITWGVMRFWAALMTHVIDASFLCFAIDVDNQQCHSEEAHVAFQKFRQH